MIRKAEGMSTLGEPPATRYFRDGDCFWKFEPGTRPKRKNGWYGDWEDSYFKGLAEFLRDPGPVVEVPADEAEPELRKRRRIRQ